MRNRYDHLEDAGGTGGCGVYSIWQKKLHCRDSRALIFFKKVIFPVSWVYFLATLSLNLAEKAALGGGVRKS